VILSTGSWSASEWLLLALAVLALFAYGVAAWPGTRPLQDTALRVACGAHGLVVVVHLLGLGSGAGPGRLGFAPVLSATTWLVLIVYVVESHFVPLRGVRRVLALMGLLTLPTLLLFPGSHSSMQAAPLWEPLHVILAIASYVLFGAAVLHAVLLNRSERAMRQGAVAWQLSAATAGGPAQPPTLPLLTLEKLTFRFVGVGFAVLSAALLIGWWFASPWRWDHKTVFSLLGWGVFAALLLGRRAFGWRGRRATRWLYAGAILLLLAYVGSRFVLEVLLHRPPPVAAVAGPGAGEERP
jgi:ABC-type uncharacterized transport system permease subunit